MIDLLPNTISEREWSTSTNEHQAKKTKGSEPFGVESAEAMATMVPFWPDFLTTYLPELWVPL